MKDQFLADLKKYVVGGVESACERLRDEWFHRNNQDGYRKCYLRN